ncbi:MAG: flagellar export protein FliJ [Clostridiales bacterium]|nr:flagellar export protein FliJ [Clostridiales bacterium]
MKKFRYSMENILRIKLKLEDQAKISYANARNRLNTEEEKLLALRQKKASYEDEQRNLNGSKLDLFKLKELSQSIEIMKINIKEQRAVISMAEQRLEVARIRLNDAMIERKTQEKLKEKAWQEYMKEFEAEEQKEIDELNSFNYGSAI